MTPLTLRSEDARVAYLATVYHLGRPGAEVDRETHRDEGTGLRAVSEALHTGMARAVTELDLTPYQITRLGEALAGLANEMKQYGIAGGRTAVPGLAVAMREVFPEIAEDPGLALDVVQHVVMLRNRLAHTVEAARAGLAREAEERETARKAERKPWQIWRR